MARTRGLAAVPAAEPQASSELSSVGDSPKRVVTKERAPLSRSSIQEKDDSDEESLSPIPPPTARKRRAKSTSQTRAKARMPSKTRTSGRASSNTRRKTITFADQDDDDENSDTMVEGETSEQEELRTKRPRKKHNRKPTLAGNGRRLLPNLIVALLAVLIVVNIPQCRDFLWPQFSAEAQYERSLEAQLDTIERLFDQTPIPRSKAPPEQPIFTLEDLTFLFYPNLYHVLSLEAPPYPSSHPFWEPANDTKPEPDLAPESAFEWARHRSCIRLEEVWNIWKFEGRVMKYHMWWYENNPGAREEGRKPPLLSESKIPGTETEYGLFDKPHIIVRVACQVLARMDTKWQYDRGDFNLTKALERFAFNDVMREAELMAELRKVKLAIYALQP